MSSPAIQNGAPVQATTPPVAGTSMAIDMEAVNFFTNHSVALHEKVKASKEQMDVYHKQTEDLYKMITAINTQLTDKDELDLTKNAALHAQVKSLKDLGIEVDEKKMIYTGPQAMRLLDSIRDSIKQIDQKSDRLAQEVKSTATILEHVITTAKNIIAAIKRAKDAAINGISGR